MEQAEGASRPRRRVGARQAEWEALTVRLGEALGCLEDGHFLVIETRDEEPYYVQFAMSATEGFHIEAVSNRFLTGWRRLDSTAEARLRRLGWQPPTDIGVGPVNWWRDHPPGAPTVDLAEVAVASLRRAFDVCRPAVLQYRAFSRDGHEILLPTLKLDHRCGRKPIEERMDAALCNYLEIDEVIVDADGDRPVRCGDAMVYVRVVPDSGYVAVFSPSLQGVAESPDLLEAVNEFNQSIRVARASVTDGSVIVAAEVYDQTALEDAVISAFKAVESLSILCAAELQPRFGGKTFFGPAVPPVQPSADPGCGLYL